MPIRQGNITVQVTPALTAAFVRTISPERWRTYKLAAGFDENTAHRLYLWNAAVGQSFHFPLQTAEVTLRNVVHSTLVELYGPNWSTEPACRAIMNRSQEDDIIKTERRHRNKYKGVPTTSQVVASLSLGFWVSLLRQGYHRSIWETQSETAFPHLTDNETMVTVSRTGADIQSLRNRIFHQEPLIGHDLSKDYSSILRMIGWICPETKEWTRQNSSVPAIIRERPKR